MIIVTGAAGFIGSNLVKGLNAAGCDNILAVDELTDGHKFQNLAALSYLDYQDCEDFLAKIRLKRLLRKKSRLFFIWALLGDDGMEWPLHDAQQLRLLQIFIALLLGRWNSLYLCFQRRGIWRQYRI